MLDKNDKRLSKNLCGADYAQVFENYADHAIAVTIQPNFARHGSIKTACNIDIYNNVERVRGLVKDLFYDLDRRYLQCPKPQFVASHMRFNGLVVLEKHSTNPHVHIVLRCADPIEQTLRYAFLLEMLSTQTEAGNAHEEAAWKLLERHGGWHGGEVRERTASVLRAKAPKGTAKVQWLSTEADTRAFYRYMAKTWQVDTQGRFNSTFHQDWNMDLWELRDSHSEISQSDPARFWAIDPERPNHIKLDLDRPLKWRRSGDRQVR
ncbi:hypothetical protein [Oceanicaulis alexandrii]|uniref:hypothetical protein n=1 Tax=Oceanicaulis alexandrii TaxID=153233 RepID=UPI003BB2022A